MQEELYIIKDNERFKLDLKTPSGITLNFKSNLFGDLSKISASFSYTFKLPMTLNNRNVLDSPEDIRQYSSASRRKFKCEFWQNGVDIFNEANLYIDTTDKDSYNAVMTWGVVAGFEALKDGDLSLRDLGAGISEMGRWGNYWTPTPDTFTNDTLLLHPYRGLEIYEESNGKIWCMVNADGKPVSKATIPVVPIRYIIDRINQTFGTKFNLGAVYSGSSYWDRDSKRYTSNGDSVIISRGVIPLVTTGLTDDQLEARTATLTNFKIYDYSVKLFGSFSVPLDAWDGLRMPQIVTFDIKQPQNNIYFTVGGGGNVDPSIKWIFHKKDSAGTKVVTVEKFKLDGFFKVLFMGTSQTVPKLIIYHRVAERDADNPSKVNIYMKELETLEGRFEGYEYYNDPSLGNRLCDVYIFDFRKSQGLTPIEISETNDGSTSSSSQYPYFFNFDRKAYAILDGKVEITPLGRLSDDVVNKGFETDVFSNLPDIGCLEFMKSLFYVIGAFPGLSRDGEIVPLRYSAINNNRYNGNVRDWSRKIMTSVDEKPEKIDFKVSGFGQHNYFLLKNDDLEVTTPEEGEDVYETGKMDVVCDNNSLEREKTIIQIPWYGPYLKSGKYPPGRTNRDMKYEEFDPEEWKTTKCEAKPALGLIIGGSEGTMKYEYDGNGNITKRVYEPNGTYRMFMEILNPFRDVTESVDYDFLQEVIYRPYMVTESFMLDEFDLRDLDYTIPIYLDKYNSHFAIVSIQRDAAGKCKCELIKLP